MVCFVKYAKSGLLSVPYHLKLEWKFAPSRFQHRLPDEDVEEILSFIGELTVFPDLLHCHLSSWKRFSSQGHPNREIEDF